MNQPSSVREDPHSVPQVLTSDNVRVPLHLRKNTRAGVMAGIERVERFDPPTAARLRDIAARTRWPSAA